MKISYLKIKVDIRITNLLVFFSSVTDLSSPGWCELAYWELRERVGHKIPVEAQSFDVFTSEEAKSSGLCLKTLALQKSSITPEQVLRTREKIGLGECANWLVTIQIILFCSISHYQE